MTMRDHELRADHETVDGINDEDEERGGNKASYQQRSQRASSSMMKTATLPTILLFLAITLTLPHPSSSQASLWPNDPDSLCTSPTSQKLTGFKPTLDCRGYVYCADGFLMGGGAAAASPSGVRGGSGVIACWPNMLYSERTARCEQWQGVDTSSCPLFSSGMMMPDQVDGNANPDRFFCGVSASNAARLCEACPGGVRLECSDPTHNCFANIRGCPGDTDSNSDSNPAAVTASVTSANNNNNNNGEGSWSSNTIQNDENNNPQPQPVPQPVPATPPPTPRPTRWPTKEPTRSSPPIERDDRSKRYCGYSWADVTENCLNAVPCPGGVAEGTCPYRMNCIIETLCTDQAHLEWLRNKKTSSGSGQSVAEMSPAYVPEDTPLAMESEPFVAQAVPNPPPLTQPPSNRPSNQPTTRPTRQPVRPPTRRPIVAYQASLDAGAGVATTAYVNPAGNTFFCGMTFLGIQNQCLQSKPCPNGQSKFCSSSEGCFSVATCVDEYESASVVSSLPLPPPTQNPSRQPTRVPTRNPTSNPTKRPILMPTPYNPVAPNPSISSSLNAQQSSQQQSGLTTTSDISTVSTNTNFCGVSWEDHVNNCATSQPCPRGDECALGERCFNASPCSAVHVHEEEGNFCGSVWNVLMSTCMSATRCPLGDECAEGEFCYKNFVCNPRPAPKPTPKPTPTTITQQQPGPEITMGSNNNRPPAPSPPPSPPTTSTPSKAPSINTNFCGTTWEDHGENCGTSVPCPRGDECRSGETCFSDSPCAALISNSAEVDNNIQFESNVGSYCGTEWNVLLIQCMSATRCPIGDECTEGEFCYKNFACNPPQSANPTKNPTPQPSPPPSPAPSKSPTPLPTNKPTSTSTRPPSKAPVINTNFCGISWNDHGKNCAGSRPCPRGDECAMDEKCFSDSPCATGPLSKAPVINTNFCGTTWDDHSKNCAGSRPCPKGDECAVDEKCFSDSPCAVLDSPLGGGDQNDAESNVGSFCGTSWNELTARCESATKCPRGDECAQGQFCYRDFVCDPPKLPDPSVMRPNPKHPTDTIAAAAVSASVFASIEQSASSKGGSGTTESNPKAPSGGNGSPVGSGSGATVGQSNSQGQLPPDEPCSICGSSSQLDWSQRVEYDGNDVSCREFDWIFQSQNIAEGSDQCLDFRAQYFDNCCDTRPTGNGCDLCDTGVDGHWHDIRVDVSVEFDGEQSSCADLSNKLRTKFSRSDNQCMDEKIKHFDDCCFKKCSLCGDSNLDWEATVYYSGEEVICHELDSKIFVEEGISSDSSRCEMNKSYYAGTCCVKAPDKPCNLCRPRTGDHFNMDSNARVSYDGEVKTCLEIYNSLYARREQSSEHCINAQGELFDQCCKASNNHVDNTGQNILDDATTVEEALSKPPTAVPATQKPTPKLKTWYAGVMTRSSPATTNFISLWSSCLLLAVGLITI